MAEANLTAADLKAYRKDEIVLQMSAIVLTTSTLLIQNSSLEGFYSTGEGGAVYSLNTHTSVFDSNFSNNDASMGAALYLGCDEDQDECDYYINRTTFKNNVAEERGGGIHYNYFAPIIEDLTFVGNQAPYGDDISAYPFRVTITNLDKVKEQVSGQTIANPIEIQIEDYYGKVINIDNTT